MMSSLIINSAIEKLTKENEELKNSLWQAQNGKYGSAHYALENQTLSARVKELEADNERMVIVGHEYSKSSEGRIQVLSVRVKELEEVVARNKILLSQGAEKIDSCPPPDAKPGDIWGAYIMCEDGWWRLTDPHPARNQSPVQSSEQCPSCAMPSGTPDTSPSAPPAPSDTPCVDRV